MNTPEGYRTISVDPSRAREVLHVDAFAFAFTMSDSDAESLYEIFPWDRTRAIEVADPTHGTPGTLAAVHASFEFRTRVPGGRDVATAGLTWVGVHPGHRRRGLLRSMIHDHFTRSLARGEAVSTLFAAEAEIYQRFGYGVAAFEARMELSRGAKLRPLEGSEQLIVDIDTASIERHGDAVRSIQERMMRPGTATWSALQTLKDVFSDLESDRPAGEEELRIVLVRDGDDPVAWALFQRKQGSAGADGKVLVRSWAALDAAATVRLWSVLVDFDLMGTTYASRVALDDPLLLRLEDVGGAKVSVVDNLWLRVLDVPAALQARGYAADCDVLIDVKDPLLTDNAGVWRLRAKGGEAQVTRADAVVTSAADVRLGIQELAAVYLGGRTVAELTNAGLVEELRPGAAQELSLAMASDMKPVGNFGF